MRTITSTGNQSASERPTLTLSGGKGNTALDEIHVQATVVDERGQTQRIGGWFDKDELLDAATEAHAASKRTRVSEPAAAE